MILKDDEIKSFMRTLEESQLRPYTNEKRTAAEEKLNTLMKELREKRVAEYGNFLQQLNKNIPDEELFETCAISKGDKIKINGLKEYIKREALKRDLIDNKNFYPAIVKYSLENIPAANVKEVVYASWERPFLMHDHWYRRCTNCYCDSPHGAADNKEYMPPFCSVCGAQMNVERE